MSLTQPSPAPPAAASRRPKGPKAQPPRQRLYSTNSPSLVRPRLETSTPKPSAQPRPSKTYTCPNTNCLAPHVVAEDDGSMVCQSCGTIASEHSHIVSEVAFGESSTGAAVVQGQYVGGDQTHARSSGKGKAPGYGAGGNDPASSRQMTELNAKRVVAGLVNNLAQKGIRVPTNLIEPSVTIFRLSLTHNFVQGRSISSVAAVAFYLQCRRNKDQNEVMLMDIAECMNLNVFVLGKMYTKMIQQIYGTSDQTISQAGKIDPVNPENLIRRFAKHLEFQPPSVSTKVVNDAIRLVQRMDRDWMATGRRPAGICGAALVLAARMNNFRRTVREVVLVVKVTEITINKRLEEFSNTDSSNLTVEQFRDVTLDHDHDPPAFYQARQEKKPKRKRKGNGVPETAAEIENDDEEEDDNEGETPSEQPAPKRLRRDADGFAIPDIPIDPALRRSAASGSRSTGNAHEELPGLSALLGGPSTEQPIDETLTMAVNSAISEMENQPTSASSSAPFATTEPGTSSSTSAQQRDASTEPGQDGQPRRRSGRPKGAKNWEPPPPSAAELALEAEIEGEVRRVLESNAMQTIAPELLNPRSRSSVTPDIPTSNPTPASQTVSPATQSSPKALSNVDSLSPAVSSQPTAAGSITSPANASSVSPSAHSPPTPTTESSVPVFTPDDLSLMDLDDDPEVTACVLTPNEVEIRERIWVSENADWLRKDHAKRIKAELQAAADREAGIEPDESGQGRGGRGGKGKKRKKGRLGDVSYLEDGDKSKDGQAGGKQGEDGGTERSAADSVKKMMIVRGFSRRVNYDVLQALFPDDEENARERSSRSSSATASGNKRRGSSAPPTTPSKEKEIVIDLEKTPETTIAQSPTTSATGSATSASTTGSKRKPKPKPVPKKITTAPPIAVNEPGKPPPSTPVGPTAAPKGPKYLQGQLVPAKKGRAPGGQEGFEKREAARQARAELAKTTLKDYAEGEEKEQEEQEEGEYAEGEEEEEDEEELEAELAEAEKEERYWNPRTAPSEAPGLANPKASEGLTRGTAVRLATPSVADSQRGNQPPTPVPASSSSTTRAQMKANLTPVPVPRTTTRAQIRAQQAQRQGQLPTPLNTQSQSQIQPQITSPRRAIDASAVTGEEEVIGSVSVPDSPLSSLPSGVSSPALFGTPRAPVGAAGDDGDGGDEDESEGDEDDYIEPDEDEDLDAAFAGRFTRKRSVSFGEDDDDDDDDEGD